MWNGPRMLTCGILDSSRSGKISTRGTCTGSRKGDPHVNGEVMLTRREALIRTCAIGALRGSRSIFATASQPATAVKFDVPANACDCHTHIFAPRQFPYW